ncbi:hypothetical protein ACFWJ5_37015 [Streptomyces qaidamensis]
MRRDIRIVLFLLAHTGSEEGGAVRGEWGVREQVLWERSQVR